ncbi:hypothetical protein U4960_07080 [Altererythrobacter sp. H2]|uniref:hypothetical protein n=1 Tax=Altererythrobacter sp. H2 TaxID=3108391 RepID=UPI002B4C18D0|nr:hypothetical protein [Altererythrobacter sp. H2]WRK97071.1 hypothetical protein U4960_07080 [Altererythrobacter sp. H2]
MRPLIGQTGVVLVILTLLAAIGALGAATIGASLVMIPIIGLIGVLLPFPTLLLYLLAILALYLLLLPVLRKLLRSPRGWHQPALAGFATIAVFSASYAVAAQWNAAAGVADLAPEPPLAPLEIAPGGTLALIGQAPIFPDRPCNTACLTLLLEGGVETLLIAEAKARPYPEQPVPGYALRFNEQGRECLRGKSYYTMMVGASDAERRREFRNGFGGNLEYELIECLVIEEVMIDPLAQPTVVNWEQPDYVEPASDRPGMLDSSQVQAVIAVGADGKPQVTSRQGKDGNRYLAPLAIWPYAGNASVGGRFEPSLWLERFRTIPYTESRGGGWWPLIAGSEAMIDRTVAWLEEVTIRENYTEWMKRTGRDKAQPRPGETPGPAQ